MKKFDAIIIGAGAAGLFFAANCKIKNGLIMEATVAPGRKLLMSGAGQCNLTHGGSIKDYVSHYGQNGKKVRTALYKANNLHMMSFFESHGIQLIEREDGKVFPASMKASEVLEKLMHLASVNGWKLMTGSKVTDIRDRFIVNERYETENLIVACGGCSVPSTGSDGSILRVLQELGIEVTETKPALVPLTVQEYPYSELSGISFKNAIVKVDGHKLKDDLLLTHTCFSGPAILNLSRYASPGSTMTINYIGKNELPEAVSADKRSVQVWLADSVGLPKRFAEAILARAAIDPAVKANRLSKKQKNAVEALLTRDSFSVSGTTGFKNAMATSGGVALGEMDMKTFESKKIPGLYIIGETLDVDGDTGGYNLQFAYSSAVCASQSFAGGKR